MKKLLLTVVALSLLAACNAAPLGAAETYPAPDPTAAESTLEVDEATAQWQGLSLDEFFEASLRDLTLRSPEAVVEFGLTEIYGVNEVALNDITDAYTQETYALIAQALATLQSYDRAALNPEQQISYDVYQWYLQDLLNGQPYRLHDYPATYFFVTSQAEQLIQFFSEIHPVADRQDAEDYIARLRLVGPKIDQLLDGLQQRAEAGITPPAFAVDWAFYTTFNSLSNARPMDTPFYTGLESRLMLLSSIAPPDQEALLEEAAGAIDEVVLPAYQRLAGYLAEMPVYAGDDSGVWRLPDGEGFYDYSLHHFTTTEISAEEIHALGLAELERIHAQMRTLAAELGYPADEGLVQLYDRVAADSGLARGDGILDEYQRLIAEAEANLGDAFDTDAIPVVAVLPADAGAFYVPASLDGSRPGAFYAGLSGSAEYYAMPTLAYHEAVPGHHFQISTAQALRDLPSFRQTFIFSAYAEGWALYAEHLAWELGWYGDDPYGDLGRLQSAAFRASRLVVDTGLHHLGWTFDQAQDFFTENTGFEVGDNVNPEHEIARYLVWPGQATAYYVGYLEILDLRQRAMDQLGAAFDLKEFHQVVLGNGSMPLEVLEKVVDQYIAEKS